MHHKVFLRHTRSRGHMLGHCTSIKRRNSKLSIDLLMQARRPHTAARADSTAAEIRLFSAKRYEVPRFEAANEQEGRQFKISPVDVPLSMDTVGLAANADVVCVFVNDTVDREVLQVRLQSAQPCVHCGCNNRNNSQWRVATT